MKSIICIVLLFVALSPLFAQTRGVSSPLWITVPSKMTDPNVDTAFWMSKQENFYLGYHWYQTRKEINEQLHINFYHGNHWKFAKTHDNLGRDFASDTGKKAMIIQATDGQGYYDSTHTWQATGGGIQALQFDPEITVSEKVRTGDTTVAFLGFNNRNDTVGSITNNPAASNFSRYVLHKDSVGIGSSAIVLSNPYVHNLLSQTPNTLSTVDSVDGTKWYLSLNLRRQSISDTAMNNDTILKITIPYYIEGDTITIRFIKFDSIGMSTLIKDTLPFGRGVALELRPIPDSTHPESFIITRSMLPTGIDAEKDITISASFRCKLDNLFGTEPNPHLGGRNPAPNEISNLGLEVRYYGQSDIAIDWLRFEVPYARKILRSVYDTTLLLAYLKKNIDYAHYIIDSLSPNARFMSLYGADEPEYNELIVQAHFTRLMGGRWISYVHGVNPVHAIVHPAFRWIPIIPNDSKGSYGEPPTNAAIFIGNRSSRLGHGLKGGWGGDISPTADHSTSAYDMNDLGPLLCYEIGYSKLIAHPEVCLSDTPWWTNIWLGSQWDTQTDTVGLPRRRVVASYVQRSLTGEETRKQLWSALIHGCKGLMFERLYHLPNMMHNDSLAPGQQVSGLLGAMNSFDNRSLVTDSMLHHWGERLFDSTMIETGGDFIVHGDETHLDTYLPLDTMGVLGKVRSDRFYIGRLSTRHEVKRVCDIIAGTHGGIADTLMRLRLKTSWYKGFATMSIGDTALMNDFVKLDTTKVRTRPVGRSTYERDDSTFVNITFLSDTTTTNNNRFFLGVLNTRSAPHVWLPDTDSLAINRPDTMRHVSQPGKVLTFLTTMEFEKYVKLGKLDKYSQTGAREITIPFNYQDTLGRYALLRVRELGGDIDTVIGQDRPLAVKFLPGEGKMFKVEILRPNEVAGELAHSNQTKLTAHALMRRQNGTGPWVESDTIVHYMTYHKQIPGRAAGWTGVYFRKSKPATKYMNTAAIQWEEEHLLSDRIFHDSLASFCDTCAYPSIVTRFDSTSQEYRSYVVYGCISDSIGTVFKQQYIVESIVRVLHDTVLTFTRPGFEHYGTVIDSLNNRNLTDWGTPMVNASDTVNFYCWSDPNQARGIVAGWKQPNATPGNLVNRTYIHWTDNAMDTCAGVTYRAQHPSMNPYSRFINSEHESDCALVWQEDNTCSMAGSRHIFYTRLWVDTTGGSHIIHGLSPNYGADAGSPGLFNLTQSIFCVSSYSLPFALFRAHSFPVAYRELFHADSDTAFCDFEFWNQGHKPSDVRFESVFYESFSSLIPFLPLHAGTITTRGLWLQDTTVNGAFVPDSFRVGYIGTLWSETGKFFDQPVFAPGEAKYYPGSTENWIGCVNYSERIGHIGFRRRPQTLAVIGYLGPIPFLYSAIVTDSAADIMHLAVTHQYPHDPYIPVSIVDHGYLSYPHLAERGSLELNDWQRNHRVYNKVITAPPQAPDIRSSGQYFFKTANELQARRFHSYGRDTVGFGVSSVIINRREYALTSIGIARQTEFLKIRDTLSTEWFSVDESEELEIITTGNAPDSIRLWIERQSDGSTWEVVPESGYYMKVRRELIDLEHGDDQKYRMCLMRQNTALYQAETVIMDGELNSGYGKQSSHKQINLESAHPEQTVLVYPNPARDELSIFIKGIEHSEAVIVSAVGGEVVRFFAHGGKPVIVNTSTFPVGMYVLRVGRRTGDDVVVPFIVFR